MEAGLDVHVDVMAEMEGLPAGVSLAELRDIASVVGGSRLDVHLIGSAYFVDASLSEILRLRPAKVFLPWAAFTEERANAISAAGGSAWITLWNEWDGMVAPRWPTAPDGVLVMLIEPGSRERSRLERLQIVTACAEQMPVIVDGGITEDIAPLCVTAGVKSMVVGRALLPAARDIERTNDMTTYDSGTSTPAKMRASVMTGVQTLQIEDRPVPSPGPDEVLVEVAAVGVCGSDVHYYRHGRIGDFVVDAPMILGHELSGRIATVGENVDAGRVGQRVAVEPQHPCRRCRQCTAGRYNLCPQMKFYATPPVDGAFCRYVTIDAEMAHPVPDSMSDEAAALLEPLSVAITTMRKAHVTPGSSMLIAGAGPIGVICAQAARAFGAARIVVSDPMPSRRERALRFGATEVLDPVTEDVAALDPQVDAFVDASGAPPAVVSGIKAVGPAGHVVLVGMGADDFALPIVYIQIMEINVTGVFRYTDTWPAAIHLVSSGAVDLDSLVTARYDLDHVGDALDSDSDPASLKSIVVPS
jgi:L-iditol 2-dehydrogenase